MAKRRFVKRAEEWAEVARWLGVYWPCQCRYSNVASYRCYYCGSRAPAAVRTLVADALVAADHVAVPAPAPMPVATGPTPSATDQRLAAHS